MSTARRIEANPAPPTPPDVRLARRTLAAALLGFFVITLDAVILNVALPAIQSDLGGGIHGLQWVVDGYTLAFAALLLAAGSLSDRIGAKLAFGIGTACFSLASALCAMAPDLGTLVGFRFVQGAAAAVMMPASMALIGQAYPDPRRRARAVATWAMGGGVASTTGPLLGGLLTTLDWRLIFLVNVPVGALALWLLTAAQPSPRHQTPFDWVGQVSGIVAMSGVTFGAIEAGARGVADPRVIGAFAAAILATVVFVVSQRRGRHPMVPPDLVRSATVVAVIVIGFAFMVGYYGLPFVMSLVLQQQHGLSALETGVVFLPMMLVGLLLTPVVPSFSRRVGQRRVMLIGLWLMTAALAMIALLPASTPVPVVSLLMLVAGLGGPMVAPPAFTLLLGAVPARRAGTASGVLNTSRQLGGAIAIALFGALLASAGLDNGRTASLLVAAGTTATAALVAARALPSRAG